MNNSEARAALLAALEAVTPGFPTAKTNEKYTPTTNVAYQRADVLFAEPDNSEYGSNFSDQGFLQVTLCFPLNTGLDDLQARVELIRTAFARGSSFVSGSTTVTVMRTPNVFPGQPDGNVFAVPIRVPFRAS